LVLLVLVATLVLLVALIGSLFVFPRTTPPSSAADAVVVLAGSADDRLPVALGLAERGSGVLVVSSAGGDFNAPARAMCHDPGKLTVYCFRPSPPDTRGEGRAIARLVEERRWTRITVVTSTYHVVRAGVTIDRCTDAVVEMVGTRPSISVGAWVTRVRHEMGGLVEAALHPEC
jgi:uncharacterized SAM-binding protein YcdF (DUF218 family)